MQVFELYPLSRLNRLFTFSEFDRVVGDFQNTIVQSPVGVCSAIGIIIFPLFLVMTTINEATVVAYQNVFHPFYTHKVPTYHPHDFRGNSKIILVVVKLICSGVTSFRSSGPMAVKRTSYRNRRSQS